MKATRALRDEQPGWTTDEFPIVLSAGERRAYTANDIFRGPTWRKRDEQGALRSARRTRRRSAWPAATAHRSPRHAAAPRRVVEVTDAMQQGHASLPNGYGLKATAADGSTASAGVAPNSLTSSELARRVRRHPVAQARARADRAGAGAA